MRKLRTGIERYELLRYTRVSECIKFSARQLESLSGMKMTIAERLSFSMPKKQVKKEMKKHPGLLLKDFIYVHNSPVKRILFWILLGVLLLIFLFILIFGLAPR